MLIAEDAQAPLPELRAFLDRAFDGDFSADDWDHTLGGLRVWLVDAAGIAGHAALVDRRLICDGHPLQAGYVEAVAVRQDLGGRGLGTALMHEINRLIAESHAIGALSTGEAGFYRRLGWESWPGPSFCGESPTPDDDGGLMVLRTPRTPALSLDGPIVADWRPGDVW